MSVQWSTFDCKSTSQNILRNVLSRVTNSCIICDCDEGLLPQRGEHTRVRQASCRWTWWSSGLYVRRVASWLCQVPPLTARPTPRSTLDHFSTSTTVITNPRSISSWVNSSVSNLYKNHVIFGICAWLYINDTLCPALSLHVYEISVILYVLYKFKNIRFYCY